MKQVFRYRLAEPYLPPLEKYISLLEDIWSSRYLTNGKYKELAEELLKDITGSPYLLLVSSGTTALELLLRALKLLYGLRGGVILPGYTFIATLTAVLRSGFQAYLVDVEPKRWTLDPDLTLRAIKELEAKGEKPSLILTVDPFGFPSLYDQLLNISEMKKVTLVADSSEALGTLYKGKPIGSIALAHSFSFSPTKAVTSGEGGLITTSNPELMPILEGLAQYGAPLREDFGLNGINQGTNARISELNASFLYLSLKDLKAIKDKRKELLKRYREHLGKLGFKFQEWSEEIDPLPSYATFLSPLKDSSSLLEELRARGIEAKRYFPPLDSFGLKPLTSLNVSHHLYKRGIALPLGTHLSVDDVDHICEIVKEIVTSR